jgi:hypothetical protein
MNLFATQPYVIGNHIRQMNIPMDLAGILQGDIVLNHVQKGFQILFILL